jgi:Galactose oxidase, central domain
MKTQKAKRTAACLSALLTTLSACELPRPSPFGESCAVDGDCAAPLACDPQQRRCLPRTPAPEPSTLGRACDEPAALELASRSQLASGTLTVTLTKDNTSPAPDACSTQRAFFVSFEVPEQLGADGAPREGMVLSALTTAGVRTRMTIDDASCSARDADACAEGPQSGDAKLTAPLVTPGLHTLRVLVDDPLEESLEVSLVLTQENCPARFLPTAGGDCYGFVPLRGPSRRLEHTVTALDDGMALIAGGRPVEGGERLGDAYTFDPSLEQFFFSSMTTARAGHSAVKLDEGSVLLVGGNRSEWDSEIFSAQRRFFFQDAGLRIAFVTAPEGTVTVALGGDTVAVSTAIDDATAILTRPSARAGDRCSEFDGCGSGLLCVDPLDVDEEPTCVCELGSCGIDVLGLAWMPTTGLDAYRRGAGVSFSGALGTHNAMFVGGVINTANFGAPEVLVPLRGAAYSPHTNSFYDLPLQLQLRTRLDARVTADGGRIAAMGGRDLEENPIADVEVFAPFVAEPAVTFMLESPRADFVLAKLSADEVIAIGGVRSRDGPGAVLDTTEIIDLTEQRTRRGPPLPYPLTQAAGDVLADGSVLIIGGLSPDAGAFSGLWLRTIDATLDVPLLGEDVTLTPSADICEQATVLEGSVGTLSATSAGAANDYDPQSFGNCTGDGAWGFDVVHAIAVPAGQVLEVTASSFAVADLVLYVLDACPPTAESCIAGSDVPGGGLAESLTVPAAVVDRMLWIVVDSYFEDTGVSYSLAWTISPP